ncbi:glycosyltransferase [Tsuneonella mangrovi]|uniref:glycosyltransferase n=1 Tax=Tsuneonella mangrovi TaxID=1982042 RepID=UPI000BA2495B|nr:glycosyltransferase [Tsuneonella mangrovi]
MHIVDVCGFYTPHGGGVRTYVEQKLAIGPQLGQEITILAPGARHEVIERGPGARIVYVPCPKFPLDRKYHYFDDTDQVHDALDALAPDFVEVSSPWHSAAMVAKWDGAAPRSMVMHADPMSAYAYRWLAPPFRRETIDRHFYQFWDHMRAMGEVYDRVVCASHELGERLRRGGVANVEINPMGIEAHRFSPSKRDPELRAELLRECRLPPDAHLLLGVGRLSAEKRWPMVVDAVHSAGQRFPLGLVLFGQGKEKRTIQQRIGGNPHIRVFGPETSREKFPRIVASADALIHGCEAETFCMAAAEARASGTPSIVPDLGGAADHARNGAGLRYKAGSAASAADAITQMFSQPFPAFTAKSRTMEEHFADLFASYAAVGGTAIPLETIKVAATRL